MQSPIPRRVAEIDWQHWQPVDRATLLFVVRDGQVLLIRKRRGLGAGKINGPGGRVEANESTLQAAVREVEEELCVTPLQISHHGALSFQFVDGYSIHVEVFRARGYKGDVAETDEAVPMWVPIDAIPYEQMWADDELWLPLLLAGRHFRGRFVFDADTMLDHEIRADGTEPSGPNRREHRCTG